MDFISNYQKKENARGHKTDAHDSSCFRGYFLTLVEIVEVLHSVAARIR